jgi:hypothetical protein
MTRRFPALSVLLLAFLPGCVTQQVASPSSTSAGMERPITTEVVRMDSGLAALQSFEPLVRRVTEGGECMTAATAADGVRTISVVYPTVRDPRTQIMIVVDAAGSILQYIERRGGVASPTAGTPPAGGVDGPEQTSIELNFQTGQARAINAGGGTVGYGVEGNTVDFQYQENLGSPVMMAEEVLGRCGGRR